MVLFAVLDGEAAGQLRSHFRSLLGSWRRVHAGVAIGCLIALQPAFKVKDKRRMRKVLISDLYVQVKEEKVIFENAGRFASSG